MARERSIKDEKKHGTQQSQVSSSLVVNGSVLDLGYSREHAGALGRSSDAVMVLGTG